MLARERPEFTPPPEPALLRSVGLAVLAHAVLVLALSWGLRWKHDDNRISVEAELWSPTVQQAAPKAVEAPPPPPPPPPQKVEQPVAEQTPTPPQRDAEIALEREKQRQAEEEKAREEAERERQQKLAAERRRQEDAQRRQEEAQKKQELAKKAAEDRKREEQARARRQQEEEQRVAKLREENLKRIQGLAGATGAASATGTAARATGPSDSYAGRIRARVRPNIVFGDDVPGNPTTVVVVRLAPDGSIIDTRVTKSSGVKSWDDAVVRALERTEVLPRDVDGRVHSPMELVFRPRD